MTLASQSVASHLRSRASGLHSSWCSVSSRWPSEGVVSLFLSWVRGLTFGIDDQKEGFGQLEQLTVGISFASIVSFFSLSLSLSIGLSVCSSACLPVSVYPSVCRHVCLCLSSSVPVCLCLSSLQSFQTIFKIPFKQLSNGASCTCPKIRHGEDHDVETEPKHEIRIRST